jgi:hypothetical protein
MKEANRTIGEIVAEDCPHVWSAQEARDELEIEDSNIDPHTSEVLNIDSVYYTP